MRLGKTLPRDRAPGEVHYYAAEERRGPAVVGGDFGEPVPLPYGAWYLEAMDAHGGWLASAVDLARFAVAFDDPAHCPLLRPASVATLFARPEGVAGHERDGKPREAYYGCGWNVRPVGKEGKNNHWHNGLLDGSASLLVCRNDGIDAAVLFNTGHGPGGAGLGGAIEGPLEQALSQVKDWPEGDLFPDYP
jgi:N-acyl-D-amino-acid deacylase